MIIAVGYFIIVFAIEPLLNFFVPIKSEKNIQIIEWLLIALAVAVIGYHIEPGPTSDLRTHYINLSRLNSYNDYCRYVSETGLYSWGFILFAVNKSGNVQYLSTVVPLLSTLIIARISMLFYKYLDDNKRTHTYYCFMMCALVQWQTLFSGLRNCLAYALISLVLISYILHRENENLKFNYIISIVLIIIAIGIHPASWLMVGVCMLVFLRRTKKWMYLVAGLWSLTVAPLSKLMQQIPITSLRYAGYKLAIYVGGSLSFSNVSLIVQFVLLIVLLVQTYQVQKLAQKEGNSTQIIKVIFFLIILAIGSFNIELLFRRMQLAVCFMLFPLFSYERQYFTKNKYIASTIINSCLAVVLIAYNYIKITNNMIFR